MTGMSAPALDKSVQGSSVSGCFDARQSRLPSGPRAPASQSSSHEVGSGRHKPECEMIQGEGHSRPTTSPSRVLDLTYTRASPHHDDSLRADSPTRPTRSFGPPRQLPERAQTVDIPSPPIASPRSRFSKLSLDTSNLLSVRAPSPQKAISPSMMHWQQLRSHVMASPAEEQAYRSNKEDKRLSGLVQKTVSRLGFRQAAETVMGLDQRRQSMAVLLDQSSGLSSEEKEEIIRERRRFARDVKACLDACTLDESRRRLQRASGTFPASAQPASANSYTRSAYHADFSAFAPLLMELHKWNHAARARKIWCRTLPHHSAVLAELGTAFLPDSSTTEGERQQVLEVFGVIVRTWAAEGPEEVAERWLWLCSALCVPEKQLRERGIKLLSALMRGDPAYGAVFNFPETATTFLALAIALLQLLHAIDISPFDPTAEYDQVMKLFTDLAEGNIMDVDPDSLADVLGNEPEGSTDGVLKELIWLGVARCIGASDKIAAWLLKPENPLIMRLVPPPLLHATPQSILDTRHLATVTFLHSISRILPCLEDKVVAQAWGAVNDIVKPHADAFPDYAKLRQARIALLISMTFRRCSLSRSTSEVNGAEDPFAPSSFSRSGEEAHIEFMGLMSGMSNAAEEAMEAWRTAIRNRDERGVIAVLRMELRDATKVLSSHGVETFLERISSDQTSPAAAAFLSHLRTSHPQLFYKPLFSLAACASAATLTCRLRLVRRLSEAVGSHAFWLEADAQMVVIILCAPIPAGGIVAVANTDRDLVSLKAGEAVVDKTSVTIDIGKSAVLLELLTALQAVQHPVARNSRLRSFLDKVESRVSSVLIDQKQTHRLPTTYRLLLLHFFLQIRELTRSGRRSGWMASILGWKDSGGIRDMQDDMTVPRLQEAFTAVDADVGAATDTVLKSDLATALARLLVLVHPCWSQDEWTQLGSYAWNQLDTGAVELRHVCAFLFAKASEHQPSYATHVIDADLTSKSAHIRLQAIEKLTMLYQSRYELAKVVSIADCSKPLFQFPNATSTVASTEIGSSIWVPPVDLHDAALNQFGKTLPIEVRRQLLDLGWSDDPKLKNTEGERFQMPISSVPLTWIDGEGGREHAATDMNGKASDAVRGQDRGERRLSSSSQGSDRHTGGRNRAVIPPIIAELLHEHSARLSADASTEMRGKHAELIHDMQRQDASALLLPFHNRQIPLAVRLVQLNSIVGEHCTPSFAYAALNAIVGLLRHEIRQKGPFGHHAACLIVIARIIPHVSAISLREIRKNRAEQALMPGTIYEDGNGFHAFPAWGADTADVQVQTAQLGVMSQLLKASPRDAYLLKRILLNLEVERSLGDLAFARAWNTVMVELFTIVQRTYNDRSELEHFLRIAGQCINLHPDELTVVSGCCRLIMLGSARFRRLFDAIGMATCGAQLFEACTRGNNAIRDAVVFTCRSIYRIHGDTSVHQLCACLADSLDPKAVDASALYDILASLSIPNSATSGMASGLRGLNDKEELATQVQMLSGPELALSDIGKDRAERQAAKVAAVIAGSANKHVFPLANIVRLFMTAIAVNPPVSRSIALLTIFAGNVSSIGDQASRDLLKSAVGALGRLVRNKQVDADAMANAAYMGQGKGAEDWQGVRMAYLRFVSAYLGSIGHLDSTDLRPVMEIFIELFAVPTADVGFGNELIAALADRQLVSVASQKKDELRLLELIGSAHGALIGRLDWSPVYRAQIKMAKRHGVANEAALHTAIAQRFLDPAIRHTARHGRSYNISDGDTALIDLATALVPHMADPLQTLVDCTATPSLLSYFLLPFTMSFKLDHHQQDVEDGVWLRLLHYTVSKAVPPAGEAEGGISDQAALLMLGVQVVKVIMVRGSRAISASPGIWSYLCDRFVRLFEGARQISSIQRDNQSSTVSHWVMWSIYEFAALYRSPLLLDLRSHMLDTVRAHRDGATDGDDSFEQSTPLSHFHVNPPSPVTSMVGPRLSLRVPSYGSRRASRYSSISPDQSMDAEKSIFEPDLAEMAASRHSPLSTPMLGSSERKQRTSLTPFAAPIIGTARRTSHAYGALSSPEHRVLTPRSPRNTGGMLAGGSRTASPSPAPSPSRSPSPRPPNVGRLIAPGIRNRFPSSAPARNVYMTSTAGDPTPVHTGLGIFNRKSRTAGWTGKGHSKEKGKEAAHKKGGAIVHLLGAPTQMLAAPGVPTTTTGAIPGNGYRAGDDCLRYRIRSEVVLRSIELARRRVAIVLGADGGDPAEEVDTTQWRDVDALHEITLQTQMLVHEEFAFLTDGNNMNDTTDEDIVIDTSRLSDMYDRDEGGDVKEIDDESYRTEKNGYDGGEKGSSALAEHLPFLGRHP